MKITRRQVFGLKTFRRFSQEWKDHCIAAASGQLPPNQKISRSGELRPEAKLRVIGEETFSVGWKPTFSHRPRLDEPPSRFGMSASSAYDMATSRVFQSPWCITCQIGTCERMPDERSPDGTNECVTKKITTSWQGHQWSYSIAKDSLPLLSPHKQSFQPFDHHHSDKHWQPLPWTSQQTLSTPIASPVVSTVQEQKPSSSIFSNTNAHSAAFKHVPKAFTSAIPNVTSSTLYSFSSKQSLQ